MRKKYDDACLNPNNSKIYRVTPNIFTELVESVSLYKDIAWNPQYTGNFGGKVPWKR